MLRAASLASAVLLLMVGPLAALALNDASPVSNPSVGIRVERVTDAAGSKWVDVDTRATVAAFDLTAGPFPGLPEAQARAFLTSRAEDLGLKSGVEDLELVGVSRTPIGDHVRFRQLIDRLPVFESDIVVTIARRSGRVVAVVSRYRVGAAGAAGAAAIAAKTARGAAIAAIGATAERIGPEASPVLGFLPVEGRVLPLVYRLVIPAANPLGDWEVMVDATSGRVLRVRDQAVSVDGTGKAFDPDPLTTAQVAYGSPGYVDGNDANTPELEAQTFPRTLRNIDFSGGLYRLTGPYCNIQEFESPVVPPATALSPDGFQFTRDAQGFEDVEVYYGIDQSQRYIQSLGFNNIQNGSIWADTHGLNGVDNSHYIPSSNRVAYGEGGVDDAEDLDVVLHEYGHAIQYGSVPGWGGGDEGAMGEGFGDYWAGSYSASISLYRWEWVFNWDGHNPFWSGRVLNHTGHYPENWAGGIHNQGQLWSSTLMQIWFEITRPVIDQIVLAHHFVIGTGALVTQAASALVTSDRNLNDGLNVDTIVAYCTQRGFMTAGQYEIPAITHTPLDDTSAPGPYTVTALCTSLSGIAAVEVRYGLNGNITGSAPMTPTGNPNEYSGQIPDQGVNVTISYYIVARNNASPINNKATDPRGAPSGALHEFQVTGVNGVSSAIVAPGRFALAHVEPNPFRPGTRIAYSLGARGPARLAIYNVSGKLVRILVDGVGEPDVHAVSWDGRDASGREVGSGVYVARLEAGSFAAARKMVLLR